MRNSSVSVPASVSARAVHVPGAKNIPPEGFAIDNHPAAWYNTGPEERPAGTEIRKIRNAAAEPVPKVKKKNDTNQI